MRIADALIYLGMGILFGVILVKSEVVSWFRIQEMFRFQAFHMYGIVGSAIAVAGVSIALLRRANATTIRGEPITISDKLFNRDTNQMLGGIAFRGGAAWRVPGTDLRPDWGGCDARRCGAPECGRRGVGVRALETIPSALTGSKRLF